MRTFLSLSLLLGCVLGTLGESRATADGVSNLRTERLARGVNLPGWLWLNRGPVGDLTDRYRDEDLRTMKELGLTCVRVPIDMANLYASEQPDLLQHKHLQELDRGIEQVLSHELAVMVDLHSISQADGGSNYSGPLGTDDDFTATFCRFWNSLARHLSRFDPDWVILEPMNEPVFRGYEERWPRIQQRVIAAIRRGAPEHTIVATGARWSNLDTLLELEPLDDANVLYNFHFYEPHIFTHQGATWSSDWVAPLRAIPYPSSPEAVRGLVGQFADARIQRNLADYGEQRWNAERIAGRIELVSEWARKHGVSVICNEFGTYKRFCVPECRVAWLRDVRHAFENVGIGWCMWTFDGSFGLASREGENVSVDRDVARALGLRVE
jgi:aryl-phospho-beta-D-glucosidase BglC (GH1 family)